MRLLLLFCVLACKQAPARPNEPFDAGPGDAGPTLEVLQHHDDAARDGVYVDPAFTRAAVAGLHLDANFSGAVTGNVYAQPLVVDGKLIVATESNEVSALDPATGAVRWRKTLAPPAPLSSLECGNIDPLGITGTPIVDKAARAIYLDAMTAGPRHLIYALSLDDGHTLPGWPLDVEARVPGFRSLYQNQRGALALVGGVLFVPYGGHYGDCGSYHGVVLAVSPATPQSPAIWRTRAEGGAIWGPSGIASDGASIFAATGNTMGTATWGDGEAVFRFSVATPPVPQANYHPANWAALDDADTDLGGSGVVLAPGGLAVALGKDGKAYVLDRAQLSARAVAQVSVGAIINAAAAYTTARGSYVAFHGRPASGCSGDLTAIKLPSGAFAWCATQNGRGSPIESSTDGLNDALVWAVGSEGDNRLRAFDADTGAVVFTSDAMGQVRRFQSPIVAGGRLYVAADGRVYAFRP